MLLHPGLVNAHTHSHGNLAKGMGDRWTLELLLASGPWSFGQRIFEDIHLSTTIGAVEMVTKGCTACYDLMLEMPAPTAEGLEAAGQAYADVGMRAVIAPMVADKTLYEAIPGLMDALTPSLRKDVERLRLAPYRTSLANIRKALRGWSLDGELVRLAVAPTIPLHCSEAFMKGCAKIAREFGVGLHSHVAGVAARCIALPQRTAAAAACDGARPRTCLRAVPPFALRLRARACFTSTIDSVLHDAQHTGRVSAGSLKDG